MSFILTVIEDGGAGFGPWPPGTPFRVVPGADVIIKAGGKTFAGKTDADGIVVSSIINTTLPVSVKVQKSGYNQAGFMAIPISNNMWIKITRSGVSVIPIIAIAAIALFILSRKK